MTLKACLLVAAAGLAAAGVLAQGGKATPAGYWEGSVSTREVPMKDPNKSLTRTVQAEFWFTVKWDAQRNVGYVSGEADAKYDAELKVDNLPKVTAPTPGGGNVKFEPSVGGKLSEGDNRRKFGIVGVLQLDPATGKGTLALQKVNAAPQGTRSQQLDNEAKGARGPDAPMEFVMRADPGVSGGIGGAAGSVSLGKGGISGSAGGMEQGASTGRGGDMIVKKIPMVPFSPFRDASGKVEKRPGGPFVASFEDSGPKHDVKWTAKQVGGEQREAMNLTPEMMRQVEELIRLLQQQPRAR